MSIFGGPSAPPPPPPPPAAPTLAQPSIAEQGALERQRLASAEGQGFNGTDVSGGRGTPAPRTTSNAGSGTNPVPSKTLLGS